MSPDEKGKVLERAVHAIEETILKSYPAYHEAAFQITRRKVLVVDGVRHEYDVWVEINLAKGYQPIFVFECKNWEAKVGKNEIIVFSEKVAAAQAQKGYFVARAYTADALAQAGKDGRVALLTAHDLPNDAAVFLSRFHVVGIDNQKRNITVAVAPEHRERLAQYSLATAKARVSDILVDLDSYASSWAQELLDSHQRTSQSNRMPDGIYKIELVDERSFPDGQFLIGEFVVLSLRLAFTFDMHIVWPKVGTAFEVSTRGRVIFCESIEVPGARMEFTMVDTETEGESGLTRP